MTYQEAKKIIGNRPRWEIKNIVKALSIASWHNTQKESERLEAGKIIFKGEK